MTGKGWIQIDGVYTHKQNSSFVGQKDTLYNQSRPNFFREWSDIVAFQG